MGIIDTVGTFGGIRAALVGVLDLCLSEIGSDRQNILVYFPVKRRKMDQKDSGIKALQMRNPINQEDIKI